MIQIKEPAVKSGLLESQQFMYDNAIAVFGIIPMMALCALYFKSGEKFRMQYCKSALLRFKKDPNFVKITSKNLQVQNGDGIFQINDLNMWEIELKELGYFEQYNQQKLISEVQDLINFLNIGVQ